MNGKCALRILSLPSLVFCFLLAGCLSNEGGSNGLGSKFGYGISGAVLSGSEPHIGNGPTNNMLTCQMMVFKNRGVEKLTFAAQDGTCLDPNNGWSALSRYGFSERDIALINEELERGQSNTGLVNLAEPFKNDLCEIEKERRDSGYFCVTTPQLIPAIW